MATGTLQQPMDSPSALPAQSNGGLGESSPEEFNLEIEDLFQFDDGAQSLFPDFQHTLEHADPFGEDPVMGGDWTTNSISAAFVRPQAGSLNLDILTEPPNLVAASVEQFDYSSGSQGSSIQPVESVYLHSRPILPAMAEPQIGLPRRRSRYFRSVGRRSAPIAIPYADANATLDPMQRWRESPPEAEAASLAAIAGALKDALPSIGSSESIGSHTASMRRAASTTSGNSTGTNDSSRSAASSRSTRSAVGRRASALNSRSRTTRARRAPRATREKRPFQCTFCCDSFRTKYDWSRHETSLHLSLEKWVCTPHGGAIISEATGRTHCAYCSMLDPTPDHLETHNHDSCQSDTKSHVFARKDHLVQHLRLVHHLETMPIIDDWKIEAPPMTSRCGFCNLMMDTWRQRTDHLCQHFHEGKTMDDWIGDHCFEPSITAIVTNALPPYVLGSEAKSPIPFSATDSRSKDHIFQMQRFYEERQATLEASSATSQPALKLTSDLRFDEEVQSSTTGSCMRWLTLGLGRYAQRQMNLGIVPTDEMFQDEARRLLFGNEDGWEQTVADNSEWLTKFRMEYFRGTPADRPSGPGFKTSYLPPMA